MEKRARIARKLLSLLVSAAMASAVAVPSIASATTPSPRTADGTAPSAERTAEEKAAAAKSVEPAASVAESEEGTAYAAGEVIVVFRDSADSAAAKSTLNDAATVQAGQADEKETISDDAVVAKVTEGASVAQAVSELSADPDVEIVQPNYRYRLTDGVSGATEADGAAGGAATKSVTTNDPFTSSGSDYYQWQLSNYDNTSSKDYGINAYDAWEHVECSQSVGVAVIDSGCDVNHADLKGNVAGAYNSSDYSTDETDKDGHGTHVCGIVGATSNNGIGGSGVTYNAKVVPIKACDSEGYFYDSYLINAYNYIVENKDTYNIRVVNMSLGGDPGDPTNKAMEDAIDKAYDAGILTVCASGNEWSTKVEYPASYANCVGVISLIYKTTVDGSKSAVRDAYSNYNPSSATATDTGARNISAPGSYIWSTYINNEVYGQDVDGSYYVAESGTSMASPVVAGVAALVFAAQDGLTPAQCKQVLYGTARDLQYSYTYSEDYYNYMTKKNETVSGTDVAGAGWDRYTGYGEVNAAAAVTHVLGTATCTISGTYTYTGSAITPAVKVVDAEGNPLAEGTHYTVSYSDNVDAGTGVATVTGVDSGGYYGTATATFAIDRATPSVPTPTLEDIVYKDGLTLADEALPSGWAWDEPARLLPIGAITANATYTPSDAARYAPVTRALSFEVLKIPGAISITGDPSKTYDGSAVADPAVSKNGTGAVAYSYYKGSDTSAAPLASAPAAVGDYTVVATMAADDYHTSASASLPFSIGSGGGPAMATTGSSGMPSTGDPASAALAFAIAVAVAALLVAAGTRERLRRK